MNTLKKRLPQLAFVLAAFAAVAFTSPKVVTNLYGEEGGTWYDVTMTTPGPTTYVCDQADVDGCLQDAPHGDGDPIEDQNRGKRFIVKNAANLTVAP